MERIIGRFINIATHFCRFFSNEGLVFLPQKISNHKKIDETLENPTLDDLESISSVHFKTYVEIDTYPLKKHIGRLSSLEAKPVLTWIAGEPDIAKVFKAEDDEFELLKGLLDPINIDIKKAFTANLSTSEEDMFSFMGLIVEDRNEEALDWVHSFFQEECSTSDTEELCVFQEWHCQIVGVFWKDKPAEYMEGFKDYVHSPSLSSLEEVLNKMLNDPDSISEWKRQLEKNKERHEDYWNTLFDFYEIEDLVGEILEDYTTDPAPSWWDKDTKARHLYTNELMSLCGMNLFRK